MAEVPHALANATARSAIALATGTVSGLVSTPVGTLMEEVLSTMFLTQLKRTVAAALAAACIAAGAGLIAMGALQPQPSRRTAVLTPLPASLSRNSRSQPPRRSRKT